MGLWGKTEGFVGSGPGTGILLDFEDARVHALSTELGVDHGRHLEGFFKKWSGLVVTVGRKIFETLFIFFDGVVGGVHTSFFLFVVGLFKHFEILLVLFHNSFGLSISLQKIQIQRR